MYLVIPLVHKCQPQSTFFNFCKNSLPDSRDRACAHVPSMAITVAGSELWPLSAGMLSMLTAGEVKREGGRQEKMELRESKRRDASLGQMVHEGCVQCCRDALPCAGMITKLASNERLNIAANRSILLDTSGSKVFFNSNNRLLESLSRSPLCNQGCLPHRA